jgi:hypothetical protein
MNVIQFIKRHACLVSTVLLLVGQASIAPAQQELLIDFGSNTSFRGLSVPNPVTSTSSANPAAQGKYWNSLQPGLLASNLIDTTNVATTVQIGWDTPVGTDSYNGPAGPTQPVPPQFPTYASYLPFTDIDETPTSPLGDLAVKEAAFDFAAGPSIPGHNQVQFEIQGLDASKKYDLTFFGSHSYSTDANTVYSVYSDNTFTTQLATTSLNVMDPSVPSDPSLHNRDRVATLTGISPQANSIIYLQFIGQNGNEGYLNDMRLVVNGSVTPSLTGDYNNDGKVNAADYVVWRNALNTMTVLPNDPAGGTIGTTQYNNWKANFGKSAGAGSGLGASTVPEPTALLLGAIGAIGLVTSQRRR